MATSIQNRTFEFQQCVSSFDKINKVHSTGGAQDGKPPVKRSRLNQQASIIAKDIVHVTDLLGKLAFLARQRSLFDDKPVEVNELTYVIKQEIFKIEKNIQSLRQFVNGDNTIQIDSQISQYSKNVLNLLNSKMKNISGEFKNVLETRQKTELINKSRTENFLSSTINNRSSNDKSPLNTPSGNLRGLGENPYLAATSSNSSLPFDPDADPDTSEPYKSDADYLTIPEQTQQMLLMEEQGSSYLHQRNTAVESIESTINEVGNLFQQLATMVTEQGETIQRIDQNVEDISLNISGAQRELLKYYANISSNRWLILKIFGVLVVFFLLWVLVS